MLQQRLGETDENYKKRKRRVNMTRMLGFGVGGSIRFLANIIYNMTSFSVIDTGTRTVDNAGSEGVKSDGDMYGSNFIELGAGQSVTYTDGTYKYIFRVSTKEFESVATNVIDFDHGQYFTATSQLSATDLTTLNANPNLIYNVWFNSYMLPSGFAKADMVNFNPANEGELSGEFIHDISVDLGSEEVVNGSLDTDTSWTHRTAATTISGGVCSWDGTQTAEDEIFQDIGRISGICVLSFDLVSRTAGEATLKYGGVLNTGYISAVGSYGYIVEWSGNAFIYAMGDANFVGSVDNISVREATTKEIINYTASCRTALANQNYGATNHLVKQDATGRAIDLSDGGTIEHNGDGRTIVVPTRTSTRTVTIEITPDVVELKTLVSTTTAGTITMIADGTVTASSGIVTIDTTTLQVGVKSLITVTGLAIDGVSTLFDGLDGRVYTYTEDTE